MADRQAAEAYGDLATALVREPKQKRGPMLAFMRDVLSYRDFDPYQAYADDALLKLGLLSKETYDEIRDHEPHAPVTMSKAIRKTAKLFHDDAKLADERGLTDLGAQARKDLERLSEVAKAYGIPLDPHVATFAVKPQTLGHPVGPAAPFPSVAPIVPDRIAVPAVGGGLGALAGAMVGAGFPGVLLGAGLGVGLGHYLERGGIARLNPRKMRMPQPGDRYESKTYPYQKVWITETVRNEHVFFEMIPQGSRGNMPLDSFMRQYQPRITGGESPRHNPTAPAEPRYRIEIANRIERGQWAGQDYVVTRRPDGYTTILFRDPDRAKAEAWIDRQLAEWRKQHPRHNPALPAPHTLGVTTTRDPNDSGIGEHTTVRIPWPLILIGGGIATLVYVSTRSSTSNNSNAPGPMVQTRPFPSLSNMTDAQRLPILQIAQRQLFALHFMPTANTSGTLDQATRDGLTAFARADQNRLQQIHNAGPDAQTDTALDLLDQFYRRTNNLT